MPLSMTVRIAAVAFACATSLACRATEVPLVPGEPIAEQRVVSDPLAGRPIVVGSKDFAEQFILGEMYALVLEEASLPVERRLNLGGSPVAHEALTSGDIDVYPEYTGTALLTILKLPVMNNPRAVYDAVSAAYSQSWDLRWLEPAPMNNTQALAMTRQRASELGIGTISDMAGRAAEIRLIGPPEFEVREDGLPGVKAVYGDFDLQEYIAVDPGLRYQGLVNGDADVTVAFGTDGEIAAFDLVILEDDLQMFPPYHVAPVIRGATLDTHPEIAEHLNRLSGYLTDDVMRRLNNEVTSGGQEPEAVAHNFLLRESLISR
jgi:osmoprotectant transport system substrate-binding protein